MKSPSKALSFMRHIVPNWLIIILIVVFVCSLNAIAYQSMRLPERTKGKTDNISYERKYWFVLHRTSMNEVLYYGLEGDLNRSELIGKFIVKTGVPNRKPTPLPKYLGREYWLITSLEQTDNPETAPFFLTLDIPVTDQLPFGPVPYPECGGNCNWELPGAFGLHGVGGVSAKLGSEDSGSSGCIRHSDFDITFIYNKLINQSLPIRYYIEEN